jgi:tetratricopeptide (TPR) repeat protein
VGASHACSAAHEIDDGLVDALHLKALTLAYMNDVAGAKRAYEGCFRTSRVATSCLMELTQLLSAEGECQEAVKTSRRWAAIDPTAPAPYRALGYALYGSGEPIESSREALEKAWERLPPQEREVEKRQLLAGIDLLTGDFKTAEKRFLEWQRLVAKSTEEADHVLVTVWQLALLEELGQSEQASKIAREYLNRRSAWTPMVDRDPSILVYALQRRLGAITADEFDRERRIWFSRESHRDTVAGATPGANWLMAYAMPAVDRADAQLAISEFPRFAPLPDPFTRLPDFDEAAANVYILGGNYDQGLALAKRAASSCYAFDSPIENTRAYLQLGLALAALGRTSEACGAYAVVIGRWGGRTTSSRTLARARAAALTAKCEHNASGAGPGPRN